MTAEDALPMAAGDRASVWSLFPRTTRVTSVIGIGFELPARWRVMLTANSIAADLALPNEADTPRLIPFEFTTSPVSESSLAQLAKRKIATLLDAGDALVTHSTVHNPRNALILELESLRDHGLVRARQISELYDGGRTCITFTFRDWRPAAGVSLKRASAIWQDALMCIPPLANGFKRIVNEEAGYQCAVPADWVIDQADARLLVLRKPGFRRTRPGLIVQTDLSARRPRTLDAMAEQLLGTPLAVTIGNRVAFRCAQPRLSTQAICCTS